ncbi:MAG: hypothetical protein IJW63_07930 [Lachnospiraceae bacterium]|nr:hypothetical protein [Lachnospiraceae bacterium]
MKGKISKWKRAMWIAMAVTLLGMSACSKEEANVLDFSDAADNEIGRMYTYTGEPLEPAVESDLFHISINKDGTFSYYESMLSSYIGIGTWSVDGDILTLKEDEDFCYGFVHRFKIDGEDILFIEEGSDNFIYIKVKDGERFTGKKLMAIDDGE